PTLPRPPPWASRIGRRSDGARASRSATAPRPGWPRPRPEWQARARARRPVPRRDRGPCPPRLRRWRSAHARRRSRAAPASRPPRLDLAPPRGQGLPVERRRPPAAHEGLQVAEAQHPRLGIAQEPGNPRGIVPPLADPVERVPTEAIDVFHDQGILRVDNHARNRPRRLPRYVRRC